MIIAVDFDNTLFRTEFSTILSPIWGVVNWVKERRKKGDCLILWTCREDKNLEDAVEACRAVGLEFDYINENSIELNELYGNDSRKIGYDILIDDKSIHPYIFNFEGEQ